MSADAYPHIQKTVGDVARLIRFPRTRVSQIVADHVGYGWSAEEILRQYAYLQAAEVYAALAYFHDHRAEIEVELAAEVAELERDAAKPPTPLRLKMLTLRRAEAA